MKIDGNQIKVGNILEISSKLWRVLKTQHTQPGKGGAYLQVEMKEIREGTKMNERFRSSENVERAILDEKICQYLYSENNKFVFMDNSSYEQVEIGNDIISEDQSKFLIENDNVNLQFYENSVVAFKKMKENGSKKVKLCKLSWEEIVRVVEPLTENCLTGSNEKNHEKHVRGFTERMKTVVTSEELNRNLSSRSGTFFTERKLLNVFRRN